YVRARRVALRLIAAPREQAPDVELSYSLEDGWPYVLVATTFTNRGAAPVDAELMDAVRADRTFEHGSERPAGLSWFYDHHFGQAYGILAQEHDVLESAGRQTALRYQNRDGKVSVRLAPGESYQLSRRVIPGANLFDVYRTAARLSGKTDRPLQLSVTDTTGRPVPNADVGLAYAGKKHARGRTDAAGRLTVGLQGDAVAPLTVSDPARGSKSIEIPPAAAAELAVELPESG